MLVPSVSSPLVEVKGFDYCWLFVGFGCCAYSVIVEDNWVDVVHDDLFEGVQK